EAIFQEDNAPIHKSKLVRGLKDNLGIVTMEWPSQSPDLSPIENVWREIKCWIHKNRKPQTEADLEEAVFAAWNTITFEKILHFIDSMPERINEVIEKNGHAIHY
ncbi:3813_t:CDS:1, partial [Ambispora gerdemannii]